jgi:E3 ubiquitin-protein ligase RNF14
MQPVNLSKRSTKSCHYETSLLSYSPSCYHQHILSELHLYWCICTRQTAGSPTQRSTSYIRGYQKCGRRRWTLALVPEPYGELVSGSVKALFFSLVPSGTYTTIVGGRQLTSCRLSHQKPSLLARQLETHENSVKMDLFSQNKFDCQICLSTVRGAKCFRLNCSHVFCRPCLAEFWSLCITEGDVDRVMCADPKCVKENRPITEDEVLRVVTAAESQRWKVIKRKKALEKDPGLVYCPMTFCQAPCPSPAAQRGIERDTTVLDDVAMRREYVSLRTCDSCEFSFCILCKRAWHSIAPCSSDITSRFLEQYMALEEGDPERLALERRFGKAQLAKLVAKLQEDEENRKWLARSTTKCPNCACFVEKSQGCSHMTCSRCATHFCYLCGRRLPGDRPYDHFSERGPCKGQLFQLTEWEPDEDEHELLVFAFD